jgi:hypothetical protein
MEQEHACGRVLVVWSGPDALSSTNSTHNSGQICTPWHRNGAEWLPRLLMFKPVLKVRILAAEAVDVPF